MSALGTPSWHQLNENAVFGTAVPKRDGDNCNHRCDWHADWRMSQILRRMMNDLKLFNSKEQWKLSQCNLAQMDQQWGLGKVSRYKPSWKVSLWFGWSINKFPNLLLPVFHLYVAHRELGTGDQNRIQLRKSWKIWRQFWAISKCHYFAAQVWQQRF